MLVIVRLRLLFALFDHIIAVQFVSSLYITFCLIKYTLDEFEIPLLGFKVGGFPLPTVPYEPARCLAVPNLRFILAHEQLRHADIVLALGAQG